VAVNHFIDKGGEIMFKRGLFVVIAFFVFSLNTKPALSITIPAGGEGIFTFDFSLSGTPISSLDEIFFYNLAFSNGWNGVLSLYDELNEAPLYSVTYNNPSTTLDYTQTFEKNSTSGISYPGLFDDQISYWKISPLTTVAVLDQGPMAAVFVGPIPHPGHATSGELTVTSPVPIPGAVWLFGSGLLGLVGIGRKRLKK